MTNLDIIEFIDKFLSEQEDVLHGIEGVDCTKSRKYLDMIKKQLIIPVVVSSNFICNSENRRNERCKEQCSWCNGFK